MPKINFVREKQVVEVEPGTNLRKAAQQNGIQLYPGLHKVLNCHGFSQCGSCAVLIKKGQQNVSQMGLVESLRLKPSFRFIGHEEEMRLACQSAVLGDIDVETQPPMNWHGDKFWA